MCLKGDLDATALEREGRLVEAHQLLTELASQGDAMALIELGGRHITTTGRWPPVLPIEPNADVAASLIEKGRVALESLAAHGDGEAMRMLAYLFLGKLCAYTLDEAKAEQCLLDAFAAGCHFAANDLHMFYVDKNEAKARFYYDEASRLGCKAVYYEPFEA